MTVDISPLGMILAYVLFFLVFLLSHINRLEINRDLIISTVRMSLQLFLIGGILIYIFELESPLIITAVFLVMVFFGAWTIMERSGVTFLPIFFSLFFSLILGSGFVLIFYLLLVVGVSPWYDPQFFIPLAGMIIGNSMNGSTLAVERFFNGVRDNRLEIETRATLGANAREASLKIFKQAYRAALLPTLSSMTGMGIVFLPGMMTGQILGGTPPLIAIKYQITIMLGILASVALCSLLVLFFERRFLFSSLDLPRYHLFDKKPRG